MPSSYTDALKEAFASAPTNIIIYETLEIRHSSLPGDTIYLVKDIVSLTATLEDASEVTFEPAPFAMKLPSAAENGKQDLNIKIDNVDRRVSDFVIAAAEYEDPIYILYRPYLSTDLTTPQLNPPLTLILKEISMDILSVSARASFFDLINKNFPSILYTRSSFPSIGE